MASIINTNLASLNAQHNLNKSSNSLNSALQRLSSGLRINSAKDDSAGLAISERMNAQIGGLDQASRNANDAISLAQTAEGALSSIGDNLQRLRTLAVQAANGSNSDADRASIQNEVSQLVSEIGRVSSSTQFNGINLLDGSFSGQTFQVGANSGQTISVSMDSAQITKLGATQSASLSASNNGTALSGGDMILNGVSIRASSATDDTASTTGGAASAIAKAAAVNASSAQTGVTATVNANIAQGASHTATAGTGTLTVNGVTTATVTMAGADGTIDRAAVVKAINDISGQTGVTAVDTGLSANGIKLMAADGRNINVVLNSASGAFTSSTTGVTTGTSYGTYTLSSNKAIVVTDTTGIANAGLNAGTYSTQTAYASTTTGQAAAFSAGDIKINGVLVGASLSSYDTSSTAGNTFSAISKVAAINAISSQTGVTATANANNATGAAMTSSDGVGTITINGQTTASITLTGTASSDRTAVVTAINAISGRTGVIAVDGGTSANGVKLVAADGRNIVAALNSTSGTAFTSATTGVVATTTYGTFSLSSSKSFTVAEGTTGNTLSSRGMLAAGTYGAGRTGQALSTVDVSTAKGANDAIVAIDNAISSVNSSRANLGAIQNRFLSTVSSLQNVSENLTAARSRITDADFAAETANLTRGQILQQAGTAMLAQANSLPNGVLALLRG
ncbi:MAG TPA: flagellin [Noviherbaspirillum sp.]|uniref:flagellin N-terminal helical domain-containing protein n=1 Tax=Noviherbaspirillum sp. TaxID=1926288 RepID=UPI002B4A8228|nr:flagellin [Noviherbaspirillum sp.]HJV88522.1 flagellin [Noviherbaspirillum sp.]